MTPEQLEQLILTNHRSLELFASQWSQTPEDCVQDAFLKLFHTESPIANPKAWLFRVVRNLAIDSGRSETSRKRREEMIGKSKSLFVQDDDSDLPVDEVQTALAGLPDDQREVIVARLWGKLTLEEIADAFQIATSTAHRRYELGIEKLRKSLEVTTSESSKNSKRNSQEQNDETIKRI